MFFKLFPVTGRDKYPATVYIEEYLYSTYESTIQSVCQVIAAGWGYTCSKTGKIPQILQYVELGKEAYKFVFILERSKSMECST